jgi:hypothetical protein
MSGYGHPGRLLASHKADMPGWQCTICTARWVAAFAKSCNVSWPHCYPLPHKIRQFPNGVKFQTWQIASFATPATSLNTCIRGPFIVRGQGSKFVFQYLQSYMLFPQYLHNQWVLPLHLYTQAAPFRDNSEVAVITREFFWDKRPITSLLSTWLTVM